MMKFKHPANESEATIPATARLWALLFGPAYFAAKGLWVVAVVETVLCIATVTIPQVLAFVWIAFALAVDTSLAKHYRRRGWVAEGAVPQQKRKTSLIVWILLLLLIPAFIYVAVSNVT
jgi:hypothetical protein